jgi:hypothetical protein
MPEKTFGQLVVQNTQSALVRAQEAREKAGTTYEIAYWECEVASQRQRLQFVESHLKKDKTSMI